MQGGWVKFRTSHARPPRNARMWHRWSFFVPDLERSREQEHQRERARPALNPGSVLQVTIVHRGYHGQPEGQWPLRDRHRVVLLGLVQHLLQVKGRVRLTRFFCVLRRLFDMNLICWRSLASPMLVRHQCVTPLRDLLANIAFLRCGGRLSSRQSIGPLEKRLFVKVHWQHEIHDFHDRLIFIRAPRVCTRENL